MPFVRKSKESEMLALIYIQQKIAQLLQVRPQSLWPESVMNSLRDSLVRSTEEVDSLRVVSSQSVEWSMRTTEESLESDYWTPQILLTRSRLEIVSPNMQSIKSSNANEKRLRNFQRPTDEQTDSEAVENRWRNQTCSGFLFYLILHYIFFYIKKDIFSWFLIKNSYTNIVIKK